MNNRREVAERVLDDARTTLEHGTESAELEDARGFVKALEDRYAEASEHLRTALARAKPQDERFRTRVLVNLGVAEMQLEHYEEALDYNNQAQLLAENFSNKNARERLAGNTGYVYLKLGNYHRAEQSFQTAIQLAREVGARGDLILWTSNEGLAKFRRGDLDGAEAAYQECLQRAALTGDKKQIADAKLALGTLWLDRKSAVAAPYLAEAAQTYEAQGNQQDAQNAHLEQAIFERRHGDPKTALSRLLLLDRTPGVQPSLHWQAQQEIANVWVRRGDDQQADQWFRRAVESFQSQRRSVVQVEFGLPFQENGTELYRDYIGHLLTENKPDEALAVLDQSRATSMRSAVEQGRPVQKIGAVSRSAQDFAARVNGTVLVYYLLPEFSCLWAISAEQTSFYRLPGDRVITDLLAKHRRLIDDHEDLLLGDEAGQKLYQMLVQPAQAQIKPQSAVYVLADRKLSELNFDTLLTPGDHPHFWLQDVTITNALSLRLLTARVAPQRKADEGNILLIGNPIYPKTMELPYAREEVEKVGSHFQPERRTTLTQERATSADYLRQNLGQYAYLHFVAHAQASDINPFDSSIFLSGSTDRLSAREIIRHHLNADLVTVSTCYSSGTSVVSGEGLVGLAWAFQYAGSRNVIGALWEVSDETTPKIMNDMYARLAQGEPPDRALHDAKLAALNVAGPYAKAYYWAPFQLYSNSAGPRA